MLGSVGTTNKMAEDVPNWEWRMPGFIVRLPQGSWLQSVEPGKDDYKQDGERGVDT